ncbi:MAG: dephospho-CoA kinase [Candidatus Altiarchaeota archaeon]|nr:dephospho-CoA kinase [Candidatus Altiarchaeota archaeon]
MIIAVAGGIAAGETTVCEILEKNGFKKISLSDMLRDEVKKKGLPVIRENLRALGDELRKSKGASVLAQLAFEKTDKGNWVIDSLLAWEEAEFLKSKGAHILGVIAPDQLRYERAIKRGRIDKGFEEFMKMDEHDRSIGTDKMVGEAEFVVVNDGSLEELEAGLLLIIKTISSYPGQN